MHRVYFEIALLECIIEWKIMPNFPTTCECQVNILFSYSFLKKAIIAWIMQSRLRLVKGT